MEKVLVTTDLSENSLAGLRFAIQLATQRNLQLIFFHVNDLWEENAFRNPEQVSMIKQEKIRVQRELEAFVESAYQSMQADAGPYQCVCYYDLGIINSILCYARNNDIHFICISTHGAGNVLKLLGSNTSELISESEIPVLCIPKSYQAKPVESVMFACDMTDHEKELETVVAFAKPISASVQVLHIVEPDKSGKDHKATESAIQEKFGDRVSLVIESGRSDRKLAETVDEAIEKYSPSLLVMFTNQKRNLLEMLFAPSQAEKYSFRTKIPLLTYTKA